MLQDRWVLRPGEREVQPRLKGAAHLVRYADDFIIMFKREEDARRVLEVLPKRFGKYGLHLHPDKTRLLHFAQPTGPQKDDRKQQDRSFDLLGLTLYWGLSRRGRWVVKQKTAKTRQSRSLKSISRWCKANRHRPVKDQQAVMNRKLQGHYAYYGVTGNYRSLGPAHPREDQVFAEHSPKC